MTGRRVILRNRRRQATRAASTPVVAKRSRYSFGVMPSLRWSGRSRRGNFDPAIPAGHRPAQASSAKVPALLFLAGLTCSEETFMTKAGAQRTAAELGMMLIAPDTSPP